MVNSIQTAGSIDKLEAFLLNGEHFDLPISHEFTENEYVRGMYAPTGTIVVGHKHNQDTVNVMLRGKAIVRSGDELMELVAPAYFISKPNDRKAAFVVEDLVWINIHANPYGIPETEEEKIETIQKLEDKYISKSQAFIEHEAKSLSEDILSLKEDSQ